MIDECTLSLCFESLPFFSFVFLRSVLPEKNNVLKGKSVITSPLMGFQFVEDDFSERLASEGDAVRSVLLERRSTKTDFVDFY